MRHGEWVAAVANGWSALTAVAILYRCYVERGATVATSALAIPLVVGGADAAVALTAPDRLGWVAAAVGMVQFLPQTVGLLVGRDSAGVSVWTWWLAVAASLLWGTYGVLHHDLAIVVPPILTGSLALVIVVKLTALRRIQERQVPAGAGLPVGDGSVGGAVDR
jgi:uncharacterized protein with PQ loop repeat